jgi:hypothetical protein
VIGPPLTGKPLKGSRLDRGDVINDTTQVVVDLGRHEFSVTVGVECAPGGDVIDKHAPLG